MQSIRDFFETVAAARRGTSTHWPRDKQLAGRVRQIRDALASVVDLMAEERKGAGAVDLTSITATILDAVGALMEACDVFLGWNERVQETTSLSVFHDAGSFTIRAERPDLSRVDVRYDFRSFRVGHTSKGIIGLLEVACLLGRPIPWVEGLVDGLRQSWLTPTFLDRPPEFVDAGVAASLLGVSNETFRRWVTEGRLPFYEFDSGTGRLFRFSEVRKAVRGIGTRFPGLQPPAPTINMVPSPKWHSLTDCPAALRGIPSLQRAPNVIAIPGIYFLCRDNEVVYVGQSRSVLARIATHCYDGGKDFNKAFYITVLPEHLDQVEREFINSLDPVHNKDTATRARRAKKLRKLAGDEIESSDIERAVLSSEAGRTYEKTIPISACPDAAGDRGVPEAPG